MAHIYLSCVGLLDLSCARNASKQVDYDTVSRDCWNGGNKVENIHEEEEETYWPLVFV